MRDSLLDSLIEPLVTRFNIDPEQAANNTACFYGAATIASMAARFDRINGMWFDVVIGTFITILLAKFLMAWAKAGPSVLDTPLGYVHFGIRMLFLILFTAGLSSIIFGLASDLIEPSINLMWQAVGIAGLGSACASMYLGACRSDPNKPGRSRGGLA